ncbi:MAG TPA: hypothetical protein VHG70_00170 [Nocardioidaceae bacterium]|nr:hypothetical protein [Nocardioidaceae bacterium]
MRHRSGVPRPRGGRVVATASVVAMAVSAILLLAALRAHVAAARTAVVAQPTAPAGSAAPLRPAPAHAGGRSAGPAYVTDDVTDDVTGDVTGGDVAGGATADATPHVPSRGVAQPPAHRDRWRAVLALLDRRRARAYAALRPRLLRRVYAPGAPVGRQDRALLRRYRERGLRVRGMRMRLLALQVRDRRGDRVALVVRERLAAATVRGDGARGGPVADDVDVRLLVLRRVEGPGWRIDAVRPVAG